MVKFQIAYGYNKEDINFFIEPIVKLGVEPIGSMGTDTPISLLSDQSKLLFSYFKQCFAQVTNPPIDPIRRTGDVIGYDTGRKTQYF